MFEGGGGDHFPHRFVVLFESLDNTKNEEHEKILLYLLLFVFSAFVQTFEA